MNIAIIDMDNLKNPFWAAGQARATREVGKILARKHNVTVYCSKYPGYKDYREEGITYTHVGINSMNSKLINFAFILTIPFVVAKLKADIIVENFNAPTSVSFAPLFTKIPVVALPTMFNAGEFARKYHFPFHFIERLGMKFYKYIMPYSDVDASKAVLLNPNINYKIIPQGVGYEYLSLKKKKPEYILFLGRFDNDQKGIDLLLHAYSKVEKTIGYPLVIAGHGPDVNKINTLIKKLHIEKNVTVIGPLYGKKKLDVMAKAAFVAFPSRHDELSLWALEALAAGLPLICFDRPEYKWMGREAALFAKSFDIDDYAEKLVLATNKKTNQSMSKQAKMLAKQYDWDNVAKEFDTYFKKIIA